MLRANRCPRAAPARSQSHSYVRPIWSGVFEVSETVAKRVTGEGSDMTTNGKVDTEKFRLRHFVERLVQQGECMVHDAPIDLIDVGAVLEGNPKAVWFKDVGPEHAQLVGNVMGSRKRLAMSLDADEATFAKMLRERVAVPHAPIEVPSAQAPVHQVIQIGDDADLGSLPVNLQHEFDGGLYISAGIDYAKD